MLWYFPRGYVFIIPPFAKGMEGTKVTELVVHITSARGPVKLKEIAVY